MNKNSFEDICILQEMDTMKQDYNCNKNDKMRTTGGNAKEMCINRY